jgi:hypothetical protein
LWSIQSAMTRKKWSEDMPDNRVSLMEALRSYTVEGAYAGFMEHRLGALKPGMLADLAVLTEDLETADPARLRDVRPRFTIHDGRVVFSA